MSGATLAMMRTPDGQGIELDKFHTPAAVRFGPVEAPVNALGFAASCLLLMTSMLSSLICKPMAQNLLARCSTRNRIGLPIFVGPRASSSGLLNNSAKDGQLAAGADATSSRGTQQGHVTIRRNSGRTCAYRRRPVLLGKRK